MKRKGNLEKDKNFIRGIISELVLLQDIASDTMDNLETRRRVLIKRLAQLD